MGGELFHTALYQAHNAATKTGSEHASVEVWWPGGGKGRITSTHGMPLPLLQWQ